jgi:hypothetical protein
VAATLPADVAATVVPAVVELPPPTALDDATIVEVAASPTAAVLAGSEKQILPNIEDDAKEKVIISSKQKRSHGLSLSPATIDPPVVAATLPPERVAVVVVVVDAAVVATVVVVADVKAMVLAATPPPPAAPSDNTTAPPTAAAVPMAPAAEFVELVSLSTEAKKKGEEGTSSSSSLFLLERLFLFAYDIVLDLYGVGRMTTGMKAWVGVGMDESWIASSIRQ